MALELYIPPCIRVPAHPWHPPPQDKPLRIQIEGPLISVQRLLPDVPWNIDRFDPPFPQPAGPELAKLTYRVLYGCEPRLDTRDLVTRDEYLGWAGKAGPRIDYYGVTFDHLVPLEDTYPEVLQINITEIEEDEGAYADECLPFKVDVADYKGKKVLAVPRCCTRRKGTTDRARVNKNLARRENSVKYEYSAPGGGPPSWEYRPKQEEH